MFSIWAFMMIDAADKGHTRWLESFWTALEQMLWMRLLMANAPVKGLIV